MGMKSGVTCPHGTARGIVNTQSVGLNVLCVYSNSSGIRYTIFMILCFLQETISNYLPLRHDNVEQAKVIKRIVWPDNNSTPLVVFGPFGTGKTFTLHHAIRHLVAMRNKRILLCTHTNSAADLHVELLHDYLTNENGLKAARPLRIYQQARR